ncbi:Glutathione S-transferase [Cystobacter fuscus DSM 2262]|uniref:Glutathione S-transferase n=1 Tax=Cystobacter fuscus (strain ATCC 25194 / DSM 2262 / NBRC 100088 / M29) TaxID=1242864 RepID=S9QA03_CYSF2|nr:glutathione S-transferase family protein [Cystobacter fuscus]EPX58149.1 Glutathione S-transferase [Cystobacter fuscus DSM 2262]
MKLYFAPRTRATRARWLLEELEVPYTLVQVDLAKQEGRTPAHLALHPLGEVPVLVDGDVTLFESSAICLYLADLFPEKHLAPPLASAERGPYLQWMLFAEVTLEPVVLEHLRQTQLPDEQKKAEPAARPGRLDDVLTAIDKRLHGREFVAGGTFTAADLVLASLLHLANTLKLLERYPRLVEYVVRHTRRPALKRAVSG